VATFNILHFVDRWPERLPLILADMAALQPDLLGLQEVIFPMEQDRVIGSAGAGQYSVHRGWSARPEYGNSLLVREPLMATDEERIGLGHERAAHRARIRLAGGSTLLAAVTHLHHVTTPEASAIRLEQAAAVVEWLDAAPAADVQVIVGDFNADPFEPTYARMIAAGFRSAYREANGAEPEATWPSGLQAPAMDTDGDPSCIDYIWVRGAVTVESARLVFDRPAASDPTLYPSDHRGVSAWLKVGETA
jgi:endonuclease/exonuclease/phosphatase family metal-dependent hydrolase